MVQELHLGGVPHGYLDAGAVGPLDKGGIPGTSVHNPHKDRTRGVLAGGGDDGLAGSEVTGNRERPADFELVGSVDAPRCTCPCSAVDVPFQERLGRTADAVGPDITIDGLGGRLLTGDAADKREGGEVSGIVGRDGEDARVGVDSGRIDPDIHLFAGETVVDRHPGEVVSVAQDQVVADNGHGPVGAQGKTVRVCGGRLPAKERFNVAHAVFHRLGGLELDGVRGAHLPVL